MVGDAPTGGDTPRVDVLILAAGAGRRMGNTPKALLELNGVSFLELVARASREGGCRNLWAVTRPGQTAIDTLAASLHIVTAENLDPERGMFSSVITGLGTALTATPEPDALLVFPVDHPRVKPETIASILRAFPTRPNATWIQPTTEGRGGHPIAVDSVSARALMEREPTETLRDALEAIGLSPHPVPVDDPHIRENFNTPEDLPPAGPSSFSP